MGGPQTVPGTRKSIWLCIGVAPLIPNLTLDEASEHLHTVLLYHQQRSRRYHRWRRSGGPRVYLDVSEKYNISGCCPEIKNCFWVAQYVAEVLRQLSYPGEQDAADVWKLVSFFHRTHCEARVGGPSTQVGPVSSTTAECLHCTVHWLM